MSDLLDDHRDEIADLRGRIADLDDRVARGHTPALGWTIADQVWHLAYFEGAAADSIERPDDFPREHGQVYLDDPEQHTETVAERGRGRPFAELLAEWLDAHGRFVVAAERADPKLRVPWYGVDMTVRSMTTARLMETWAHGLDVTDALQVPPIQTDRLEHVAFLGCRALPFAFGLHDRPVPDVEVGVTLRLPSGREWQQGPADALNQVRGDAFDFCAVITQRRHVDDTTLEVSGPVAAEWLRIGQAYAGVPGSGRPPGWHTDPQRWR